MEIIRFLDHWNFVWFFHVNHAFPLMFSPILFPVLLVFLFAVGTMLINLVIQAFLFLLTILTLGLAVLCMMPVDSPHVPSAFRLHGMDGTSHERNYC